METIKILPSQTTMDQKIQLSLCDVYSPTVWVMQTNFWRLKDSVTHAKAAQLLQESLRRTICEIPALAGTLVYGPSGDPRDLAFSIESDAHVDFSCEDLSAEDDVPSFDELEAQGFPMTGLRARVSPPKTLCPVSVGARGLEVKLCFLKQGLALTWGFNHLLTDAGAIAEIERIWAAHTVDVSAGRNQLHRVLTPDVDIRTRLSAPVSGAGEFNDPYWAEFPTEKSQLFVPRDTVKAEAALAAVQAGKQAELTKNGNGLEETNWLILAFTADKLAKLKVQASASNSDTWISTMDALMGFFWSILATVQSDIKDDEISSCFFPINIRARVDPTIPQEYIGNAVDVLFTECSLTQLASNSGISYGAQTIRKAIGGWSVATWDAWRSRALSLSADKAIVPNPFMLMNPRNFAFNDYSKSRSNTLDWGVDLGQIRRTRYLKPAASLANCATAVIVHPRLANGGLEVAMSCNERVQKRVEADELIREYCTVTCITP